MIFFSKETSSFYDSVINTTIPNDCIEISESKYLELLNEQSNGKIITTDENGVPFAVQPPVVEKTPDQIKSEIISAIQQRLDTFAQTRGYDGILSACSYAGSTIEKFAAEGQCCVAARDVHWAAGYAILADVESGTRSLPTVDEVLEEMPALAWPDA